jgi:hypothetical protein
MARSPVAAMLSHAAVAPTNGSTIDPVVVQASEMRIDGMRANASRMRKRRPRNPTGFNYSPALGPPKVRSLYPWRTVPSS